MEQRLSEIDHSPCREEILRAEIERLSEQVRNRDYALDRVQVEVERLTMALEMFMRDEKTAAQNVRMLRAEVERLSEANGELAKMIAEAEAEIERLRALLRPFVNMVAEPEDFAAARRALEGK